MRIHHILFMCLILACNSRERNIAKLPPINYPVEDIKLTLSQEESLKASMARGKEIYNDFCINCHMADGKGVGRTYPPLANSGYLKEKQEESMRGIKYGMQGRIVVNGKVYNNAMMPMGLDDREVADVMNYINNSWGNKNETLITAQQVSKIEK